MCASCLSKLSLCTSTTFAAPKVCDLCCIGLNVAPASPMHCCQATKILKVAGVVAGFQPHICVLQAAQSTQFSLQEVEAMSAFNHEMLMTCLPAAFEGAFAHMLFFLQRRGPDPNLDSLYRLLRLPGNSQPAADMFAKVSTKPLDSICLRMFLAQCISLLSQGS